MLKQMNESIINIARELKAMRAARSMTQHELGERVGLPQSHISKIEQGRVDLQLSSLIEIARALELEVTLIPRKSLPAVESAVRVTAPNIEDDNIRAQLALHAQIARDASQRFPQFNEITGFNAAIAALQKVRLPVTHVEHFYRALKPATDAWARLQRPVLQLEDSMKSLASFRRSAEELKMLRNAVVHQQDEAANRPVPAYRLDDDE
jgi:transcriptional regulator with XRE-family HTH domain